MDTVYIRLESKRARTRVDSILGRKTPWVCGMSGRNAPRHGCTTVSIEEWRRLDQQAFPGVKQCTRCPLRQAQQRLL
jgi:hypothetical protein